VGDHLTDRWRSAFTATPRELFIPDRALWVPAQGIKTLDAGRETLWLLAGDAWASISDGQVRQAGARNLWDEAVTAYQWWTEQDRPDRQQFHLTVTRERQWVWLDDPANTVTSLA
jgi:hypothetical protein